MSSNKKLEALKALFKKEQNKDKEGGGRRGDMYPFWEMKNGEEAVVRLLPDKNPENPYMFYVDKLDHKLPIDGKNQKIPCLQMYAEKCPICELSREFYKAEGKGSANGKLYYRTKTSLARILVIKDPLPADEETGENCEGKVMNTQLGYQLMEKIKAELVKPDMDVLPWDFKEGYNFTIAKTAQGDYGNYAMASGFARRPTALSDDIIDEIELIDLSTLLPANPGYEFVKRKLDAHLNGTEDTDGEEGEEDETPKAKPAKASVKPSRVVEEEDDEDEIPVKSRKPSRVVEEEEDEEEDEVPVKARKPSRVVEEEEDDELDDILAQVKRRNRK